MSSQGKLLSQMHSVPLTSFTGNLLSSRAYPAPQHLTRCRALREDETTKAMSTLLPAPGWTRFSLQSATVRADCCVLQSIFWVRIDIQARFWVVLKKHQTAFQQCRDRRYAMLQGPRQNVQSRVTSPRQVHADKTIQWDNGKNVS